jgi:hypothetical protein
VNAFRDKVGEEVLDYEVKGDNSLRYEKQKKLRESEKLFFR